MKQRIRRICLVIMLVLVGLIGVFDNTGGGQRAAYADDPTATPTPTNTHPDCASIGCGG